MTDLSFFCEIGPQAGPWLHQAHAAIVVVPLSTLVWVLLRVRRGTPAPVDESRWLQALGMPPHERSASERARQPAVNDRARR